MVAGVDSLLSSVADTVAGDALLLNSSVADGWLGVLLIGSLNGGASGYQLSEQEVHQLG